MDTSSPLALAKVFLPKVPLISKTLLSHTLGISPHSTHWDLKTELTVNILRSFIYSAPQSITQTQNATLHDPGIKGRVWISKVTLPIPAEDDARQKLFQVIEELKAPGESKGGFTEPDLRPVEAEWTGYRSGATRDSKPLRIPESQQYTEMMKEVKSPLTILYMHGGAHYLLDPASYRQPLKKLAKLTGGRILSLRYRLAPQNPFPAALLDCLIAYLNLLFPPTSSPDSFHTPVQPENIIFSGDSAGGNLSLSLLLLLLHLQKTNTPITWNNHTQIIPLPAGLALNSPWLDLLRSSPSQDSNLKNDYLPPPSYSPNIPSCPIWPSIPPRSNIYCEDALLTHPLVSPLLASVESWNGAPPMLIQVGSEMLTDENKIFASRIAKNGGRLRWEQYEWMPHCFALVVPGLEGSRVCFERWAGFCGEIVRGDVSGHVNGEGSENKKENEKEKERSKNEKREFQTSGITISAKTLKKTEVHVASLWEESEEVVTERIMERARVLMGAEGVSPGEGVGTGDANGEGGGSERARL